MNWQFHPVMLSLGFSAIVALAVGIVSLKKGRLPQAWPFSAMMVLLAIWCALYALEIGAQSLQGKLASIQWQYIFIPFVPVLWFSFASRYVSWGRRPNEAEVIGLSIVPAMTIGIVWSNAFHGLMYGDVALSRGPILDMVDMRYGPWFWVHTVYSYLLTGAGTALVGWKMVQTPWPYRRQAAALFFAALIPWLGNVAYVVGERTEVRLDPTPVLFAVSGLTAALALWRFDLLSLVPAAREAVFDGLADGLVVLDAENRVVDVNGLAAHMVGARRRCLIGNSVEEAMPFVADVLARGEATGECEVPAWDESRDGLCVIEVRTKELKESSGRVLGTVVVLRDVTAERSAQRTLQANLSLLSTLLDAIHLGVAVEDHRGALAMSNLALREIFQGAASARIGLADELPGLDQDTPSAGDWAQLANLDDDAKQLSSIEVPLPNGRVLECDVVPFPAEDGKRGRIWLWRDVTDRRQEEETQRRQREMEAVGRLAGGIAHNFNDLLTVINGYSQVVSEALDASDPLQRSLTRIRQAGDRAASLTRQLLVFSGRLAAHARALHLNAVIDDVRPVLERSLGASARLCLDLAEDLPMIWSNVAHLEEMLVNLVDNARDSIRREGLTEGEGTVRIATREKRLDGEGSDGWAGAVAGTYVELSVCDNGRPMADEELAELFVPFRSGVGSGGGPGLGLAIVYGLVEQAGGRIRVESGLGAGTEFRILLPCRDVAVGHTSALSEIAQESLVVTPDSVP